MCAINSFKTHRCLPFYSSSCWIWCWPKIPLNVPLLMAFEHDHHFPNQLIPSIILNCHHDAVTVKALAHSAVPHRSVTQVRPIWNRSISKTTIVETTFLDFFFCLFDLSLEKSAKCTKKFIFCWSLFDTYRPRNPFRIVKFQIWVKFHFFSRFYWHHCSMCQWMR